MTDSVEGKLGIDDFVIRNVDNGCGSTSDVEQLNVLRSVSPVTLYPNPANTVVTFKSQEVPLDDAKLFIYSLEGRNLSSKTKYLGEGRYDISSLLPGMYSARLRNGQKTLFAGKLVVMR